jgi:hypothetical protein
MDETVSLTLEETQALLARVEALEKVEEAARNLLAVLIMPRYVDEEAWALKRALKAVEDQRLKDACDKIFAPVLYPEREERWH